jgi:hypothetical protein
MTSLSEIALARVDRNTLPVCPPLSAWALPGCFAAPRAPRPLLTFPEAGDG